MIRAALIGLAVLTACEPPAPPSLTTPDGAHLYAGAGLCYACHGRDGAGTTRGPDLTDGEWLHFASRPSPDSLAALLTRGVAHPIAYALVMPPAPLRSDEIQAVAAHVLTFSGAE